MTVENAYHTLFTAGLIVIGVCMLATVIKSILGPRISDRLMTVNMIGTLVTGAIAILSALLSGEEYLVDICIIYVLVSFISVVVFTSVFINEYVKREKNDAGTEREDK